MMGGEKIEAKNVAGVCFNINSTVATKGLNRSRYIALDPSNLVQSPQR